ncbi:ATP-binding protein [Streptomyces odonnellii]|uniref:ATP-binding protein n=1 Tax=Streptomyces odonnellii TaxID=1417980 RepID=UPI0006256835|nr:ATP-binding protein [Streptomyces odonnellii]
MTVSATAPTDGRLGYSETLPCEAGSAAAARRLVRTALTEWGLEHVVEDGVLVVTELVANAVNHTQDSSIQVIVTRPADGHVRIGVMDRSRTMPVLRCPADTEVHGRGLALVDALAVRWGTVLKDRGKCVWGELKAESR